MNTLDIEMEGSARNVIPVSRNPFPVDVNKAKSTGNVLDTFE